MQQLSLLQDIFTRLEENKHKVKEIKAAYKDALTNVGEYQEITDKLKTLRDRKKQIEETIKQDFSSELTKFDDLKIDIESDKTLLTDAALSQLMKGETVEVTDRYDNKYEPVWAVKFKKE